MNSRLNNICFGATAIDLHPKSEDVTVPDKVILSRQFERADAAQSEFAFFGHIRFQ